MTSPHLAVASPLQNTSNAQPPPLPPRPIPRRDHSPPHSPMAMLTQDPRSASMQSLLPDPAEQDTIRRRLLLVYIHGFMGDETSFRSFPAHVHNLVTVTLSDSHIVHTKIYPRYQSKNAIQVARDRFATWLAPHADQWTDIILLGHSMGGLLAADAVLLFRFHILGTIHFDVPLVGISPKIVKAGLSSIFTATPAPTDFTVQEQGSVEKPGRVSTLLNPKPSDPNYNPSYDNDVHLPVRKGWENTLHWMGKHYKDGLREAAKGLVKSHLKFGYAMGDWNELLDRYAKVRVLEENDENKRKSNFPQAQSVPRIRFVNYHTISTGRPKKPKPAKSPASSRSSSPQTRHQENESSDPATASQPAAQELDKSPGRLQVASANPQSSTEDQEIPDNDQTRLTPESTSRATPPDLPAIPPIPKEPPFVDLAQFSDKAQRKVAEKNHEQALKEYQKAVKARNKIIHQRDKLEEKWLKQQEQRQKELAKKKEKSLHSQSELDRLKAESKRMQLEAERMQAESERRQADSPKATEAPYAPIDLESDLEDLHLDETDHQKLTLDQPYANYEFSRSNIMGQASPDEQSSITESEHTSHSVDGQTTRQTAELESEPSFKKKKLKKFCLLPPKDASGNRDPTWIPVLMDGMDEVTAHTSLFFINETYERLVGDVGARIEDWTREADSVRLAREMEGLH